MLPGSVLGIFVLAGVESNNFVLETSIEFQIQVIQSGIKFVLGRHHKDFIFCGFADGRDLDFEVILSIVRRQICGYDVEAFLMKSYGPSRIKNIEEYFHLPGERALSKIRMQEEIVMYRFDLLRQSEAHIWLRVPAHRYKRFRSVRIYINIEFQLFHFIMYK